MKKDFQYDQLCQLNVSQDLSFTPRKGSAITADFYIKECLSKLHLFIKTYHSHNDYVFWPDLSTSHYANKTLQWLLQYHIKFIPKQANLPKARPIEDLWSTLADKIYERGWQAKSVLQLERRIYQKIKQIGINILEHMMKTIRTKL